MCHLDADPSIAASKPNGPHNAVVKSGAANPLDLDFRLVVCHSNKHLTVGSCQSIRDSVANLSVLTYKTTRKRPVIRELLDACV